MEPWQDGYLRGENDLAVLYYCINISYVKYNLGFVVCRPCLPDSLKLLQKGLSIGLVCAHTKGKLAFCAGLAECVPATLEDCSRKTSGVGPWDGTFGSD